jgi:hypothetical protein
MNTVNPIFSKMAFCDSREISGSGSREESQPNSNLYCLDELVREIEECTNGHYPWASFPQLKTLLKNHTDYDTDMPMITSVDEGLCGENENVSLCERKIPLSAPSDVQNDLFRAFSRVWKKENKQMDVKREQMEDSVWNKG